MTRSTFVGSALALLCAFSVISYAKTFIQGQEPKPLQTSVSIGPAVAAPVAEAKEAMAAVSTNVSGSSKGFVVAPQAYTATAYSLRGRTASGRMVSRGLIAADPSVLPLGSRVRVEAGSWSGEYLVADTGGAVKGRRIDIWIPTTREAMQFGRRVVKLTVLEFGGRRGKSMASARPRAINAVNATPQTQPSAPALRKDR
ncbi:MAG: 3D domain-containing protein [Acidobacteriota bacterium]